jgi:hypothetical protein
MRIRQGDETVEKGGVSLDGVGNPEYLSTVSSG